MKIIKLIYIGREFYQKSGTIMSSLYEFDTNNPNTPVRSDWGEVSIALEHGHEVLIMQPNEQQKKWADDMLKEFRERKS